MAAGALALAVSAIFATKANKKFGSGTKTAFNEAASIKVVWSAQLFTTVAHSGFLQAQAELITLAAVSARTPIENGAFDLYTSNGNNLFIKP